MTIHTSHLIGLLGLVYLPAVFAFLSLHNRGRDCGVSGLVFMDLDALLRFVGSLWPRRVGPLINDYLFVSILVSSLFPSMCLFTTG